MGHCSHPILSNGPNIDLYIQVVSSIDGTEPDTALYINSGKDALTVLSKIRKCSYIYGNIKAVPP